MTVSDEVWIQVANDKFIIGKDSFDDLEIHSTEIDKFYYFYNKKESRLIKQFILNERDRVDYLCQVTLIKKRDKFTPRLSISIRDKSKKIQQEEANKKDLTAKYLLKANVNLDECHENFWKLISFLQSLREIEVPKENFSLVTQGENEIVTALRGRDVSSISNIIKQLSSINGVTLSEGDINQLLKRKERLREFGTSLKTQASDEGWWQDFFERNKWIFGYGLNYQILRQELSQPNYGGTRVDGKGGQRGDYLSSTDGDLSFTVLVEIKTPDTPLLQGSSEIRSGAWSLSKDLTDAVSQIQSNIDMWDKQGSRQPDNIDRLEKENIFTVQPKGIVVIASLSKLDTRSKRETFQRFRKSLHGIDILTFDELLKRARFIVEEKLEENRESIK